MKINGAAAFDTLQEQAFISPQFPGDMWWSFPALYPLVTEFSVSGVKKTEE
jgi:hypothetical protein